MSEDLWHSLEEIQGEFESGEVSLYLGTEYCRKHFWCIKMDGNKIDNICQLNHRFVQMNRTWELEFFWCSCFLCVRDLNIDALHYDLIKYISWLTLEWSEISMIISSKDGNKAWLVGFCFITFWPIKHYFLIQTEQWLLSANVLY